MAIAWRSASDGMRPRFLAFARLDIRQASSATLILLAVSARHPARGFKTYDTNDREQISSLFAWRSGAREELEVKDKSVAFAASGGDHFVIVLEFEFLSRIIASMQSMMRCRRAWRPLRVSNPAHRVAWMVPALTPSAVASRCHRAPSHEFRPPRFFQRGQ